MDNVQDNRGGADGLDFNRPSLVHLPDEGAAFAARMEFAMMYARMTTPRLRQRMMEDYGIRLSKSTMSKILNGKTKRTRFFMEMADVLGVNPRWLATGKESMVDTTGRLSSKDQALKDVKRLVKQYLVPPKRSDLIRMHDKLTDAVSRNRLSRDNTALLEQMLSTVLGDQEGAIRGGGVPTSND
ncbi:transcriptional regulator [Marinobacter gelidimuriae]|jgi:transcriptional regulator with XRE-family HTH domain|uniref:transcriptional regulator n=1 Tax=Marinobacter gelidimuriae TaxID=2739064 RepID=UPI000363D849|nr:transcriptional regulator [Marinobacter gelidimuriae]